ncbi:MAG: SurA N-terminal domain-containing protein [Candidatus Saccharimonadales bacterium]
MKRIKQHLTKLRRKKQPAEDKLDSRITNETVAEHREQIIAGGKRFKYPVQYSRHKLVINSTLIALGAILLAAILFWWQLYPMQNSSKFMYRMTQIIPVPIASVDGESVPYSTYLKRFRSSVHYLQEQVNLNIDSKDGKKELEYRKREELNNAIKDAYATKLARENKVTVTDGEVDAFIKSDLESKKVTERTYEKTVLNTFYDWSMADYRSVVKAELLRRKVAFAIDGPARDKADRVMAALRAPDPDFGAIAKAESDDEPTKQNGGDTGDIPLKTLDMSGVIAAVNKLTAGQMTELIYGTDGYYVAKLTSKNATSVRYQVIKVTLTEFDKRLADVKQAGKIKEFITVAQ